MEFKLRHLDGFPPTFYHEAHQWMYLIMHWSLGFVHFVIYSEIVDKP